MIISGKRQELEGSRVPLEGWFLAPLGLNRGAQFTACYETAPDKRGQTEVLISTIQQDLWGDVWRIEAETIDRAGNLLLLFKLFKEYGIEVIASEGSINAFGKRHTMSFIIGCQRYHTLGDKYSTDRRNKDRAVLQDLEFILKLNFGDQLTFSDAGFPRVKIKRISEYWRLAQDIERSARDVVGPKPLKSHGIDLDRGRIRALLGEPRASIYCSPAVDTKNRLLRLLFFVDRPNSPEHIQVAFDRNPTAGIMRVFEMLFELDQNIIKHQVRAGGNEETAEEFRRQSLRNVTRLDVTFEPYNHRSTRSHALEEIIKRISRDKEFRRCGGFYCKSHSGVHPGDV